MVLRALITGGAVLAAAGTAAVELRYRRHPGNDLRFEDEGWQQERTGPGSLRMSGRLIVHNVIPHREVMLTDVGLEVRLLGDHDLDGVAVRTRVTSLRKDYPTRADGYWVSYVVKPASYASPSPLEFEVDVTGPEAALDGLYGAWVEIRLDTYGFAATREQFHHVVLPLRFPDPAEVVPWREAADGRALVRTVRTHLLGPFDDPLEVVRRYALPHARPGDIVTIGETPLAVIQGRFHDPRMMAMGWPATRLAQFMSGEGSLGTAGGMQALMNEHGTMRVIGALAGGVAAKAVGKPGWFYRLAGPQARLVDDVTGTLPPYDKFIVVGPERADEVCVRIAGGTGLAAAVVDANNLGKVDVVGFSPATDLGLVCDALRANPAGNGDEGTPIVLIRPTGGPGDSTGSNGSNSSNSSNSSNGSAAGDR